ncbi:MAG: hypothetical protein NT171_19425 [Planctomycetota bacterium]|jgi:hypothetical protein|nr:hypothetical protein [Planctomycetota bacterium]
MTVERFRDALRAQPFVPFTVHLADGRSIPVTHPELVASSPTGRTAVIMQYNESTSIIDLLLVASIEFPASEKGAA